MDIAPICTFEDNRTLVLQITKVIIQELLFKITKVIIQIEFDLILVEFYTLRNCIGEGKKRTMLDIPKGISSTELQKIPFGS